MPRTATILILVSAGLLQPPCAGQSRATDADVDAIPPAPSPIVARDPWAQLAPDVPESQPADRSGAAGVAHDGSRLIRRQPALRKSASDSGGAAPSVSSSILRTTLSLAGVIALIVLLAWGYRVVLGSGGFSMAGRPRRPGLIEIVSRTSLSARQSLYLVRVGPRMVLVGATADRFAALDVISDPEVTAQLAGQALSSLPHARTREFEAALDGAADELARAAGAAPATPSSPLTGVRSRIEASIRRLRSAAG